MKRIKSRDAVSDLRKALEADDQREKAMQERNRLEDERNERNQLPMPAMREWARKRGVR